MPTGYIVCPEHGDIYRQRGLTGHGDRMNPALVEPLAGGPVPELGTFVTCPLCERTLGDGLTKRIEPE